ncbi:MAG: transposase zinc-binding domain-containing protein [Deltaproteobacteria bacterium]|nr:transposase zinc-binding domain-containing protein [Deltaproteobacteria bacterium]
MSRLFMGVEVRGTAGDLLHRLVREGLPRLRDELALREKTLPRWVERELEGFVGCGDPTRGFAWLTCKPCDEHVLVPLSCKGRGFCPACCGRRMASGAAWLVESVLPHVATRQWVLTVPWRRRWLLASRPELALGVRIALDRIERWYRAQVGAPAGRSGAVTVIQRFGSSLALNLHYHILHLDGVYVRGADGRLSFRQSTPHQADVEALVFQIAAASDRWLARQGFPAAEASDADPDDALALLQQASLAGVEAVGPRAGKQVRRVQVLAGREIPLPPRCASYDGYNLHAGVSIQASPSGRTAPSSSA